MATIGSHFRCNNPWSPACRAAGLWMYMCSESTDSCRPRASDLRSRYRRLDYSLMTTREFLRARVIRLYSRIWPVVLVLFVITVWANRSALLSGLVLIVITAFLAAYIVFMRRTPCLRCSAPLRNAALNWGSSRQSASRCPHCRLGIDEQVTDPLFSGHVTGVITGSGSGSEG